MLIYQNALLRDVGALLGGLRLPLTEHASGSKYHHVEVQMWLRNLIHFFMVWARCLGGSDFHLGKTASAASSLNYLTF